METVSAAAVRLLLLQFQLVITVSQRDFSRSEIHFICQQIDLINSLLIDGQSKTNADHYADTLDDSRAVNGPILYSVHILGHIKQINLIWYMASRRSHPNIPDPRRARLAHRLSDLKTFLLFMDCRATFCPSMLAAQRVNVLHSINLLMISSFFRNALVDGCQFGFKWTEDWSSKFINIPRFGGVEFP